MKLICWSVSDVGKKRDHNEDSYLADEGLRLYAVADGMGGHQAGDQASRMAVEILQREIASAGGDFDAAARRLIEAEPAAAVLRVRDALARPPSPAAFAAEADGWGEGGGALDVTNPALQVAPPPAAILLRAAARLAGRTIFDAAQADPLLAGMGTTLTAMLFHRDRANLVHVGDSRAFLYRDGKVTQLTEDHSWIAEQVKAGVLTEAEAKESKFRHIITRSVGFEREVEVDVLGVATAPGDCYLLCSDGMSNYIEVDELARILQHTYHARVPQLCVDLANDRGGDDNITVVLVQVANDRS